MCFRGFVKSRRILQTHCALLFILYSTGVSWCILNFFFLSKIIWPWAQWGSILQFKWKLRLPRSSGCGQHQNFRDSKHSPRCWKQSIQHTKTPEPEQDWSGTNAQNGSPRSQKQIVHWVDRTENWRSAGEKSSSVVPPSPLKHISKPPDRRAAPL